MKRAVLFYVFFTVFMVHAVEKTPSVVAVLFFNDETEAVFDTIKPLLEGGITSFMLYNRGGGRIAETAKEFLQKNGCDQVEIIRKEFINDGVCKNYICMVLKSLFNKAAFGLFLNGQWRCSNVKELISFCEKAKDETPPVYWIRVLRDTIEEEYRPCLVRCDAPVTFEGVIDALPQCAVERVPETICVEWERIPWGIGIAKKQYEQELKQLLDYYARYPHDPHTLFCLGQVCSLLNDDMDAYKFYELRSHVRGDVQEDYLTFYKLGEMLARLHCGTPKDIWDMRYTYYMKAHELRPWRAEPLIRIAQHYQHCDTLKAFLFARKASELPFPKQDTLCIDRRAYEQIPYEILSVAAWYVGEYEIGENALRVLLEKSPNDEHLKNNLEWYVKRKAGAVKKDTRIPDGFGVDFNQSMSIRPGYDATQPEKDPFLRRVKHLYDKYIISDVVYSDEPRIPKIIHQIWLGSDGHLPVRYKIFQETWLKNHPDWQYMLWTEKEIEEFGLQNKAIYDAATNYREKSDIARHEIVYRFGGMYADTDFECFRSFDVFHHCCDFYSAFENEHGVIANGFFGAAPGNKIIKRCIDNLAKVKPGNENELMSWQITGPLLFTNSIKQEIYTLTDRTVIFPVGYVYSWYVGFQQPRYLEDTLASLRPESFAVHHWHGTYDYAPKIVH